MSACRLNGAWHSSLCYISPMNLNIFSQRVTQWQGSPLMILEWRPRSCPSRLFSQRLPPRLYKELFQPSFFLRRSPRDYKILRKRSFASVACFTGKKSFREYVCVKIAARGGGNPRTASPLAAHLRSGRTCSSVNVSLEKVQEIIILPFRAVLLDL